MSTQFLNFIWQLLELWCYFSIGSHTNHESFGQKVDTCAMRLLLINNFSSNGVSGFSYHILYQFIVGLQTVKVVHSSCLFHVLPGYTTRHYPHLICAVVDAVCTINIMNTMPSEYDNNSHYIMDHQTHSVHVTIMSEPEFQLHFVSYSNMMVYPIIGIVNNYPATITLL